MSVYRDIGFERALTNGGQELKYGPLYQRSLSIQEVGVSRQLPSQRIWTKKDDNFEGSLRFVLDDARGCVQSIRDFGRRFSGIFLDKVQADIEFTNKLSTNEEFHPVLKKLLTKKLNWSVDFNFSGLATFISCLIEWTEKIMNQHASTLRQADVYGLVAVAQFSYMYHKDVWRAFCELWSPLTNTFHHVGGELGISLHDLKQIAGLPILGEPYKEFLPSNEQLSDTDKFPPTVLELQRIHADLCTHHNSELIYWEDWLAHFYRGEETFIAFAEGSSVEIKRNQAPRRDPPSPTIGLHKQDLPPLIVSEQGELTAFLSLILSRFVLPQNPPVIRHETFVMECFMAQGTQISLAPTVLGHIYHGLNEMATHPTHPGRANPSFGIHFVIGWMSKYFPSLYRIHDDNDFPKDYPLLRRCARLHGEELEIHQARLILRHAHYVRYRIIPFGDKNNIDRVDPGGLSDIDFERLLCIRSTVLPIRMGQTLILEPYYPNRFARQFGFDQGVPANALKFSFQLRAWRSLGEITSCYAHFFRRNTGEVFHIPQWGNLGRCTWSYCAWWVAASTPYLSQSVQKVHVTLTNKNTRLRDRIYVITDVRRVVSGLKGVRKTSNVVEPSPNEVFFQPVISSSVPEEVPRRSLRSSPVPEEVPRRSSSNSPMFEETTRRSLGSSLSVDVHYKRKSKRARRDSPTLSEESDAGNKGGPICLSRHHSEDEVNYEIDQDLDFDIGGVTSTNLEIPVPVTTQAKIALIVGSQQQPPEPKQDLSGSAPPGNAPDSLDSIFPDSMKPYLCTTVTKGIKAIAEIVLASQSTLNLQSTRAEVFDHLEALKLTAKAAKVDNVCLSWIISQVQDLFENADVIAALESTIDAIALNEVSTNLSHCNEHLAYEEKKLFQLQEGSLVMKEQEGEILMMKEKLRTLEESFVRDNEALANSMSETEHRIQLAKQRQRGLEKLEQEGKTKLEDLNSKKTHLQTLIKTLTSFASIS